MNRLFFVSLAPALAACGGSFPPPAEGLAQAEAASRSATEVGANNEPTAALHVKMANDQIAQAKKLMADGDNRRADAVLGRARADAELGLQLTREAKTRAEADTALAKIKSTRGAQ